MNGLATAAANQCELIMNSPVWREAILNAIWVQVSISISAAKPIASRLRLINHRPRARRRPRSEDGRCFRRQRLLYAVDDVLDGRRPQCCAAVLRNANTEFILDVEQQLDEVE